MKYNDIHYKCSTKWLLRSLKQLKSSTHGGLGLIDIEWQSPHLNVATTPEVIEAIYLYYIAAKNQLLSFYFRNANC
jgi:hypothetical protein